MTMPWDVVVSRQSDGVQLSAQHYEESDAIEYMPVTDSNIALAPASCG